MSDQGGQSALESALIGCFGGLFATLCVYPLDLVRSKVSAHIKRAEDEGPPVTSLEVMKAILKEKGAAGLYEGMGGRAVQCFVEDFVFFWWYSSIKAYASDRIAKREGGRARPLNITEGLLAGAVAGIINNACTIPFDVVATNHQISGLDRKKKDSGKADTSIVTTAREVWSKGGIGAFWSGLAPSCLLVINPAINFSAFDRLKLLYNKAFKAPKGGGARARLTSVEAAAMPLGPLEAFLLGAVSKAIATSITFPLIRAKVLMMQAGNKKSKKKTPDGAGDDVESGGSGGGRRQQGMAFVEILREAIKAEGVGGLYKGLGVQLSRSAVAAAIMFMTREQLDALTAGTLRRLKNAAAVAAAAKKK